MVTDLRTRVEQRRRALIELCAHRPHDTIELMRATGSPRDTLKNDLARLEKDLKLVRVDSLRLVRRGGSKVLLWSVPGADATERRTPLPVYPLKTRWVTFNPYNPEPVTP